MKKILAAIGMTGIIGIMAAGAALAGDNDPVIQQREANQEARIDQGVKSGRLTPKEAGRLEAQQARIQQREDRMKADGNLTAAERRRLTSQQNRASRDIYRLKHNNRTANVQ
ncbi:MAG TPA: hypothetical protein VFG19_04360 [Geobacteraceae bacterium]|nr:hypothetical protein [Geobacteraceae bacterium]